MKRAAALSVALALLGGPGDAAPKPVPAGAARLTVNRCRLMLDGRPYRGIGVNALTAITRTYADPGDRSGITALERLGREGIPFVRFAVLPLEEAQLRRIVADPAPLFAAMDAYVAAAEKAGVGLVPSLAFEFRGLPRVMGERVPAWGDPASKTSRFAATLARRLAARYATSRAIWIWEFSNEANDWPDQPDAWRYYAPAGKNPFTAADNYTGAQLNSAFATFRQAIRAGDPHRLVEPGHNAPRRSAWRQRTGAPARPDNVAEFERAVAWQYAGADLVSMHFYPQTVEAGYGKRFADRPVPTVERFIPVAAAAARKICRPLFAGEFGPAAVTTGAKTDPEIARFRSMLDAILKADVPLAAMWVYDFPGSKGFNADWDNPLNERLRLVAAANARLRSAR